MMSMYSIKPETSTYLSGKGYTIFKECLNCAEKKRIKTELTVKPNTPNAPVQSNIMYKVFEETDTVFHLPRYYGIANYGIPDQNLIPPGNDINVPFVGSLRPDQDNIVQTYVAAALKLGGGLLELPCGEGKTVDACKIISMLNKKTLFIVHKGDLVDQVIERMSQFIPTARVGRIQGQTVDIDNKDVVVAMLQSLSMKQYPPGTFESFGLTIVDECHHISSEVFCRSLQRFTTRYTLGLSATMVRKDGLSNVFKMFLGEIVFSKQRPPMDHVLVKAIQYKSQDAAFNITNYDYRGNPAYSTMITKLCSFSPRSEFILKVLQNELNIAKTLGLTIQVMILAHNRNLLTYLYEAIVSRNISPVGYYFGGMKQADLKESAGKQVIVATYSMAAEGLDIKTLNTLILATPKTDIIQAAGRIVRMKHERPMIVDIIDSHDMFLRQWQKRRRYFSENKYNIKHTTSDLYDADKWTNGVMKIKGVSSKNVNVSNKSGTMGTMGTMGPMVSFMKKTTLSNCDMLNDDDCDDCVDDCDYNEVDDISNPENIQVHSHGRLLLNIK